MNRVILSASTDETILAVTRQHKLVDLEIEQQINTEIVGCIYKGIVKNIVPAVDGIFVDIGIGKNAFLRRTVLKKIGILSKNGSGWKSHQHSCIEKVIL